MNTAHELLDAQCARLSALDPALPETYLLPRGGEPIMAELRDGSAVAGLIAHTSYEPGSLHRLWSATETFELFPLVGDHPQEGMDALLAAWRRRLAELGDQGEDSGCLVTWPSRDVRATRTFLDHGFVPMSCLAVRPPSRVDEPINTKLSGTVKVRRAGPADLEAVVELSLAELEYAALVGSAVVRDDAVQLKRKAAQLRLHSPSKVGTGQMGGDPVWLAEQDGVPIALAECGWIDTGSQPAGHRLRPGKWGYVNCVSVLEQARGTGIGQHLMALAHNEFARAGAVGSYLYYHPANPLSPVFWARQGYRPLWTMWEVRPVSALR